MSPSAPLKQCGNFCQWLAVVLMALLVAASNLGIVYQLTRSRQQALFWQGWEHTGLGIGITLQHGSSFSASHARYTSSLAASARHHSSHSSGSGGGGGGGGVGEFPRVFVGVLSSSVNMRAREVIRQTWGADPLLARVMFFCQRPTSDEAFRQLRHEAAGKRDVFVTSEAFEGYYNKYSVLDIFKVAASMSESFDYVVKTDDDVYVRPALLLQALRRMPLSGLYAGSPMKAGSVLRRGRYHRVPYENWRYDHPVRYAYGAGYVLSMNLAVEIAAGAPHIIMPPNNLLIIEDIAVGYWVDYLISEQNITVTYNDSTTRGDTCNASTMFYHVTTQPKWAEVWCMHQHGGVCCDDQTSCSKCLRDLHLKDMLGPSTDEPMVPQPPFAPGCFPSVYDMAQMGCPILDCSLDVSCTVHNTSCCAYFNFQKLDFLDRFLTAHCLQDEYMLVYGTILGAVRDSTILPHTEDIDVGITPLAIQFLERNSTKELLWRHGYTFWYHYTRGVWKICPHAGHPSAHFRAAMTDRYTDVAQYEKATRRLMSAFVDAWLMWPVSSFTPSCSMPTVGQHDLDAMLQTPWDQLDSSNFTAAVDVCSLIKPSNQEHNRHSRGVVSAHNSNFFRRRGSQRFCVSESDVPHLLWQGSRTAEVADKAYPIPENYEKVMAATYGRQWRTPRSNYHGPLQLSRTKRK